MNIFVKEIQILLALVETCDVCSWNILFLLCISLKIHPIIMLFVHARAC